MSEKRRGLGRGLGALIPNTTATTRVAGERPVNVFFPGKVTETSDAEPAHDANPAVPATLPPESASGAAVTGALAEAAALLPTAATQTAPEAKIPGVTAPAALPDALTPDTLEPDAPTPDALTPEASTPTPPAPAAESLTDAQAAAEPAPAVREEGEAVGREGGAWSQAAGLVPVPGATFAELPVDAIRPNPRQPRQVFDEEALAELVYSIKEIGVLQPIVVRPADPEDGEARYELIMGERRWRASQEAGLATVPAIIRETSDDDLLRDALLENLHRSQLNPLEEAAAYQQLLDDFGCTHEDLATKIGRSRPQISNTLRLLKLPPLVQRRLAAGVLSAGHARALLGLDDAPSMEHIAQRIVSEGLSVRAVEEIVALGDGHTGKSVKKRPRAGTHHSELDEVASRLGDRLETRVTVALGRSRGRLSIDFASVEDLNRIIGLLSPDVRQAFAKSS